MLSRLHIENVAVIEKADIELDRGFNVLTGETGAGKSILIDSINLVLGERVSRELVRAGARGALVSAVFSSVTGETASAVHNLGYACEDGELLIQREISVDGRGTCRISGRPATVSILRSVGRALVNIHGQHENQSLLSPERHVDYLDTYAGTDALRSSYSEKYAQMKKIEEALSKIAVDEAEKARRADMLKYEIEEIEAAHLKPGEEEELKALKSRIINAEKIEQAVSGAFAALDGSDDGPGARALLSEAAGCIDSLRGIVPKMDELSGRLHSLGYELDDCVHELGGLQESGGYDPREIDDVEGRLDTIYKLKRKYGGTVEEVLAFLENARVSLKGIETSEEREKELSAALETAVSEVVKAGTQLTEARKKAAISLEAKIKGELAYLDMPYVEFLVSISALPRPERKGCDSVEFMLSANPGSPPRPLAKSASGGEISRIMLAIKNVLADSDGIDTMIFDEIDTGVSGRAASKIGKKLWQVSKGRQVLCVTHLAQIAAQADRHILIEKQINGGETFTAVKPLDVDGRKRELARIIGGDITDKALSAAAEMLANAHAGG